MKERPINLKPWEVLAILQGSKTQLRRVVKPQPSIRCPFGQVGDRLWVRETFDPIYGQSPPGRVIEIDYRADHSRTNGWRIKDDFGARRWTPSIHMPRWASRILLEVVSIKVLSKDGRTVKYGVPDRDGLPGNDDYGWHWHNWLSSAVLAYRQLWDQINGYGLWEENPWVWVVEFKRISEGGTE